MTSSSEEPGDRNIVFVLGRSGRGGAERVVSRLVQTYADDGWKVTVVTLLSENEGYHRPDAAKLVNLSTVGQGLIPSLFRWPLRAFALRRLVVERQARVVVAFMAPINVVTLIATLGLACPVVVSERSDPLNDRRSRLIRFLTHRLYPRADLVVFQTEYARQLFPGVPAKKTSVLPNPVSVAQIAAPERRPLVVSVGRLAEVKNHALLVRAFAQVVQEHPEYRLEVIGEGVLRPELSQLVRRLELTDAVAFPGESANVHADIAEAQVFVLSSDYEGFSNALLEAMRMGICCISTDCAGSRELIHDGVNGRLVPRGDCTAMARAILDVIENLEARSKMASEGMRDAQRYDAELVLNDWKCEIWKVSSLD